MLQLKYVYGGRSTSDWGDIYKIIGFRVCDVSIIIRGLPGKSTLGEETKGEEKGMDGSSHTWLALLAGSGWDLYHLETMWIGGMCNAWFAAFSSTPKRARAHTGYAYRASCSTAERPPRRPLLNATRALALRQWACARSARLCANQFVAPAAARRD